MAEVLASFVKTSGVHFPLFSHILSSFKASGVSSKLLGFFGMVKTRKKTTLGAMHEIFNVIFEL